MEFNGKQSLAISANPPPISDGHWTETRLEILSWLNEQSPSLAELYQGAVYLISQKSIPGRIRLVAHCGREICNQLVVVKIGKKSGGRLDYVKRVEKLAEIWTSKGFSLDGVFLDSGISHQASLPTSSPNQSIPHELFVEVATLIKDHKHTSDTLNNRIIRYFKEQFPENNTLPSNFYPAVAQWKKVTNWFVGNAHDKGKIEAKYDEQELLDQFDLLENLLGTFAHSFYSIMDKIDEILEEANS